MAEKLVEKAKSLMDAFEWEAAKKFCERALETEPTHVQALELKGVICMELGDFEEAKNVSLHFIIPLLFLY